MSSEERLRRAGLAIPATFVCPDYHDDYLGQQVTKLWAETYTDADVICHVDSDCIFYRAFGPDDLLRDGKIEIWHTPYDELPDDIGWQRVTQRTVRIPVQSNFMRRQPVAFPRTLYAAFRAHVERLHHADVTSYVLRQQPREFSEYNALGAFAYAYQRDTFTWTRVAPDAPNEGLCKWFWSWGGLDTATRSQIESLLSDGAA